MRFGECVGTTLRSISSQFRTNNSVKTNYCCCWGYHRSLFKIHFGLHISGFVFFLLVYYTSIYAPNGSSLPYMISITVSIVKTEKPSSEGLLCRGHRHQLAVHRHHHRMRGARTDLHAALQPLCGSDAWKIIGHSAVKMKRM